MTHTDLITALKEGAGAKEDHAEWHRRRSDEVLLATGKWKQEAEGLRGPNGVL